MKKYTQLAQVVLIVSLLVLVSQLGFFSGAVMEPGGTVIYSQNFDSAPTGTLLEHVDNGLVPQADSWWCSGSVGCTNYISPPVTQFGAGWHPLPWNPGMPGYFVSSHSIGTGKSIIGYSYGYYEHYNKILTTGDYTDYEYDVDFQIHINATLASNPEDQLFVIGTYHDQGPSGPYVYIKASGVIRDAESGLETTFSNITGKHTFSAVVHHNSSYRLYLDGVEFGRGLLSGGIHPGINRISFAARGRDSSMPLIGYMDNIEFTELTAQIPGDGIINGFEVCDSAVNNTAPCPPPKSKGVMTCAPDGMSWDDTICETPGSTGLPETPQGGGGGGSGPDISPENINVEPTGVSENVVREITIVDKLTKKPSLIAALIAAIVSAWYLFI